MFLHLPWAQEVWSSNLHAPTILPTGGLIAGVSSIGRSLARLGISALAQTPPLRLKFNITRLPVPDLRAARFRFSILCNVDCTSDSIISDGGATTSFEPAFLRGFCAG